MVVGDENFRLHCIAVVYHLKPERATMALQGEAQYCNIGFTIKARPIKGAKQRASTEEKGHFASLTAVPSRLTRGVWASGIPGRVCRVRQS